MRFGSKVLPSDFFAETSGDDHRITSAEVHSELIEARELAISNPDRWVRVGALRVLQKEPSAWCSEVNLNQKVALRGYVGSFRACYWYDHEAGAWGKALKYFPSTDEDEISDTA